MGPSWAGVAHASKHAQPPPTKRAYAISVARKQTKNRSGEFGVVPSRHEASPAKRNTQIALPAPLPGGVLQGRPLAYPPNNPTPKEVPEKPKSFKHFRKSNVFVAFSPFRFRWALEASSWLQDGPRRPQERPKRGPRRPQERPRAPQERPKRAPRGDFSGPEGAIEISAALFFDRWPPRWPKRGPRGAPEGPKTAPRAPKRAPRAPQEGPKRGPRGSLRPPTCPQEGPMMAPRHSQFLILTALR